MTGAVLAVIVVLAAEDGACDEPYVTELVETGDAFRAVGLLKQREFQARGSDLGFACARRLLALYLAHDEHDLADAQLARLLATYPQAASFGPPAILRAELAYLFGNPAEVRARLGAHARDPAAAALLAHADALAAPTAPVAACAGCEPLQALHARAETRARKSPGLALGLSVIPGLGQIYAGRTLSGVGSFLLHAALGALTAYAVHRDERAAAVALGSLGGALYLGNLYAGWEAARRENDRRDAETIAAIRRLPLPLALTRLAR